MRLQHANPRVPPLGCSSQPALPDPTWRLGIAGAQLRGQALSGRAFGGPLRSVAAAAAAAEAVPALENGSAGDAATGAKATPQAADMATRLRIGFRLEAQRGFGNVRGAQRLSEFATDTFLALMPTQVSYNAQPSSSFPICHELQETELLWWTPASGHPLVCLCK